VPYDDALPHADNDAETGGSGDADDRVRPSTVISLFSSHVIVLAHMVFFPSGEHKEDLSRRKL
jgi:hypothetical protein